jgi:hypothetical protein
MSKADQKLLSDIEEYGWHIVNVLEDEEGPPYSFSIGLYHTFRHPEVIIIGLDPDLMQNMINWIGADIRGGKSFEIGKEYADLIEGFNCTFMVVQKKYYSEYLGYAMWFYKGDGFPVIQCVWPTTKGKFPWEKGYPKDLVKWQQLLDE